MKKKTPLHTRDITYLFLSLCLCRRSARIPGISARRLRVMPRWCAFESQRAEVLCVFVAACLRFRRSAVS